MAYDLHIERMPLNDEGEPTPIPLEDWKAAVAAMEGVRLCPPGPHTIINPKTGSVIRIPSRDGDAEVFFASDGGWHSVFRWFEGAAIFNGRFATGDLSNPVWTAAAKLAFRLNAVIRGDDGEIYDQRTGKVIGRI